MHSRGLCRSLRKIPEGFGGLTSLKQLVMQECVALEEFPPRLGNLWGLEVLDFSKCWSLNEISEGFGGLTSLKELVMQECDSLEEFALGLSNLFVLGDVNLVG